MENKIKERNLLEEFEILTTITNSNGDRETYFQNNQIRIDYRNGGIYYGAIDRKGYCKEFFANGSKFSGTRNGNILVEGVYISAREQEIYIATTAKESVLTDRSGNLILTSKHPVIEENGEIYIDNKKYVSNTPETTINKSLPFRPLRSNNQRSDLQQ
jgi:hypothetical protein